MRHPEVLYMMIKEHQDNLRHEAEVVRATPLGRIVVAAKHEGSSNGNPVCVQLADSSDVILPQVRVLLPGA